MNPKSKDMISRHGSRLLTVVLAVILGGLALSCEKNPGEILPPEPVPELVLGQVTELSFPADGGTAEFIFTTNQDWTLVSEESWLSTSPGKGAGSGASVTVTVSVEANPIPEARNALIVIKAGALSREIPVTQEAAREYSVTQAEFSAMRGTLKIGGVLYIPEGKKGKMPAVICCHGLSGSHADTDAYGYAAAKMGFVACCFDFCGGPSGLSLSDGERSENSVLTEVQDLAAVFEEMAGREDIDASRIFLMGGSQGGLVAALYAAENPSGPKALGLLFPAFNIPDLARLYAILYGGPGNLPDSVSLFGHTFWRQYVIDAYDLYPFKLIGTYERPVLILHGDKDELVPVSYSRDAVKIYKNANLVVLEGQGHGFDTAGRDLAIEYMKEFLEQNLP